MSERCGCCACLTAAGPHLATANRPGLSALRYRAGTHASMFEAMVRRLTIPIGPSNPYSLHGLTTRELDDPAMAMLDAWATVGDVLTFYQERIINEGYLRTATERRSILELARLVGYQLKPGVSSTVYVAYTVDDDAKTIIPAGSKSQSIPGAEEKPQTFETSEEIEARGAWNALRPRLTKPQIVTSTSQKIWLQDANTRLDPGDTLLLVFSGATPFVLRRVQSVFADRANDRLVVTLQPQVTVSALAPPPVSPQTRALPPAKKSKSRKKQKDEPLADELIDELEEAPPGDAFTTAIVTDQKPRSFFDLLSDPPALAPAGKEAMPQSLRAVLSKNSDFGAVLAGAFRPQIADIIYGALGNFRITPKGELQSVHVFRRRSPLFGHNAPLDKVTINSDHQATSTANDKHVETDGIVWLAEPSETIVAGGFVVVDTGEAKVARIDAVETRPRTDYLISAKSTRLTLDRDWFPDAMNMAVLRSTIVLAESEQLTLSEEPIFDDIRRNPESGATRIELESFLDGFKPGRWIVVTGERTDIAGTTITTSELAMVASVEQKLEPGGGEKSYSIFHLAPKGLNHRYRRSTVKIMANVAKATHGETRSEILGGGDASKPLQTFTLHQTPLTFVPSPTPSGAASTLAVRVNDVLWHETDSLAGTGPVERVFVTKTDDEGKTSVTFGNGREGSRVPTGPDNVRAVYRSGIGKPGNVRAGQIATAISRPLGVKDVVNPLPATGGADPESRDDARRNVPVALQALGRVVSVRDYADFARTFAGIAKAASVAISDGSRRVVHVTIGGTADIDIDESSDLYRNLLIALRKYGDPYQPFVVAMREKMVMAGSAGVRIHPDYLWSSVQPKIRAALLDAFSYDRRAFGQRVFPSEVIAAIHGVEGVEFVELQGLGSIDSSHVFAEAPPPDPDPDPDNPQPSGFWHSLPEITTVEPILPRLAHLDGKNLVPAQIAYLPAGLADLFILTEIPR
jgi:predicted phage baseplate assembly protein